jgi:hypothetical protein
LFGFVVVAEPHEGGRGGAADEGGRVVAQVLEGQGERYIALLAGGGEGFQVGAADVVGAGEDDGGGRWWCWR